MLNKTTLLFVIGLSMMLYGAYIPAKALLAQYLIHQSWNESQKTGASVKPWTWADMYPVMKLTANEYNQELIVLSGDTGNVLAFGPGHNLKSGMPGQNKTVMISAHRDTHFKFLEKVKLGDTVEIETKNDEPPHQYEVVAVRIIDSTKEDILIQHTEELKLVTCYPFDKQFIDTPYRLIVSANRKHHFKGGSKKDSGLTLSLSL